MQIFTIDELIESHWRGCDVRQGETPEAYAMRREFSRYWPYTNEGIILLALYPFLREECVEHFLRD